MNSVTNTLSLFLQFYTWFDTLLETSWEACQGTDVLIESPSAMVGIHLAEKLGKTTIHASRRQSLSLSNASLVS